MIPDVIATLSFYTLALRYFIDILTRDTRVGKDFPTFFKRNFLSEVKPYGGLVLLGFDITAFRPVAYQRGRLPRPL